MPFPTTGELDNFNRPDGGLGLLWTVSFGNGWHVFANEAGPFTGASVHASSWGAQFSADQEVHAKLRGVPSTWVGLYARLQAEEDFNSNHYRLEVHTVPGSPNDLLKMVKKVSDVDTQMGADIALSAELANDDLYGLEPIGTTIKAYRKPAAGSWAEVASRTDSDVTGAGYIGMVNGSNAGTPRWDDFSGGGIGAAGSGILTHMLMHHGG